MKKYNTPHRRRVIKTRLTEEEYAEFSERVTLCKMSQSEYIRQALIKSSIRPVITVSPVNDELLSAVGKLTAEYGKIGGNLNQIARCLNEYGAPYNALSQEVRAAITELAAVLITAFLPSAFFFTPFIAFLGGMVAFLLVYSLSWKGGLSPLRIILVGVAVNAMFTGLMSAFNSGTGSSYSGAASIVNANITQKTWDDFGTLVVYVVVGIIASFFVCGRCNLLALEDKTARSLGVNVTRSRIVISVIAVLLASISTAVIGPISFLGLIVPHIARLLVGSDHKVLVPYSVLLGAFTLLLADTIGRTIAAPYEISAAVIMSVVGGPFFIILLRRSKGNYGN